MLEKLFALTLLSVPGALRAAELPQDAVAPAEERMDWWRDARFGLFIHWGLYAVPAGEWAGETQHGEWIRTTAHIPLETYEGFVERFDPKRFDARAWARLAKEAGMRYVVITTKHHDGFCLFDSQLTDFDVMSTPFRRDVMRELADACRAEGLRICWYHSIMDWHHPDYLPRRDWETRTTEGADFDRYVRYLRGQVRELLTNYGPIGVMWFDGEWEPTWDHARGQALYDLCRELQPSVIVNNRVDKGRAGMAGMTSGAEYAGDFGTPEQEVPATGFPGVDWETCMTMNDHWGFNRADQHWKSSASLVRELVDIASKGGNFLLNIGPTADGEFPGPCVDRLHDVGLWMNANGASIHGTSAGPFEALAWGRCTQRRNGERTTLYLHVFDWPTGGRLALPELGNRALGARLLERPKAEIEFETADSGLVLRLPERAPDPVDTVVTLEIEGAPIVYETPRIEADAQVLVKPLQVRLVSRSGALELRYTLDGSEPRASSILYTKPFWIEGTTTVKARCFVGGRAVGATAERRFEQVEPLAAEQPGDLRPGLVRQRFAGDWDALPDFGTLEPIDTGVAESIAPWHPDGQPVPERCGERLAGWIEVPASQVYVFALESDDGSRLRIDERAVVDDDGLHASEERTGTVVLAAGMHRIAVEWFNKTGDAALSLAWKPVGERFEPVSSASLYRR